MTVRLPMRFTEVPLSDLNAIIDSPSWVLEQKFDGTRVLLSVTGEHILAFNGGGSPLGHTAATQWLPSIRVALAELQHSLDSDDEVVLDGELLIHSGEYIVFDLPFTRSDTEMVVKPFDPFSVRRRALESVSRWFHGPVRIAKQARTSEEKDALAQALTGSEGLMAKHLDGQYKPGQRVTDAVKLKFTKTADVVVTDVKRTRNEAGREMGSISFAVFAPVVVGTLSPPEPLMTGACSVIGKPHVEAGDVIEVAYLYYTGSTLYQPRMVRVRDDKEPEDCDMSQFPHYSRAVI